MGQTSRGRRSDQVPDTLRFPSYPDPGALVDYSHSVTTLRDVPILYLAGAVDLESASQIVAELEELARTADRVVVDLTDVSFFDSAGLSALDQAQTTAATHGARIALACPNPKILRLFQITGLDDRFAISATAEEAVGL